MGIAIFVQFMQAETCKVEANTISDNLCNKLLQKDGYEVLPAVHYISQR